MQMVLWVAIQIRSVESRRVDDRLFVTHRHVQDL
jgi:hypothetical protein